MLEKIIQWIKKCIRAIKPHQPEENVSDKTEPDQQETGGSHHQEDNGAPPRQTEKDPVKDNSSIEEPKPPRDIGSKRGPKDPPSPNNNSREGPPPRPELICREAQDTRQWEVVLPVSKECNVKTVRHDNKPLEALNGEYCPSSLTGCLSVEYADCKKTDTFSLCNDKPMVFKLKGDWQGMACPTLSVQ